MMIAKMLSICHVCTHDKLLRSLKAEVVENQIAVRNEWRGCPVGQVSDHLMPNTLSDRGNDWFLLNESEKPTVIPSYSYYSLTWEKAMFLNPFEVDWFRFELHGTTDLEYALSLLQILEDQRGLWCGDEDTKDFPFLRLFSIFVKSVRRLVMYCLGAEATNL